MLFIVALAGLVCLGRALWYAALLLFGHAVWDSAGWSMFTYQFGAVICTAFVVGYWNYLAETRAKSLLLSLLGLLFLVNLHIAFAVPLAQRLEARMPLLWHGAETQGRVVRVYMRETEKRDFLFHSQRPWQKTPPRSTTAPPQMELSRTSGRKYKAHMGRGYLTSD